MNKCDNCGEEIVTKEIELKESAYLNKVIKGGVFCCSMCMSEHVENELAKN